MLAIAYSVAGNGALLPGGLSPIPPMFQEANFSSPLFANYHFYSASASLSPAPSLPVFWKTWLYVSFKCLAGRVLFDEDGRRISVLRRETAPEASTATNQAEEWQRD